MPCHPEELAREFEPHAAGAKKMAVGAGALLEVRCSARGALRSATMTIGAAIPTGPGTLRNHQRCRPKGGASRGEAKEALPREGSEVDYHEQQQERPFPGAAIRAALRVSQNR